MTKETIHIDTCWEDPFGPHPMYGENPYAKGAVILDCPPKKVMEQELREQDQKDDLNETPKKIWVEHEEGCWPAVLGEEHQGTGTPYIRADTADELIKALIAIGAGQGDPKTVAIQALENYMEKK